MSETTKGQSNRKRIMVEMVNDLPNYDGLLYDNSVLRIAYKFNLAPDTIRYSYLPIFIEMKMISIDESNIIHINKGKKISKENKDEKQEPKLHDTRGQ
jgi:hypothetical protein